MDSSSIQDRRHSPRIRLPLHEDHSFSAYLFKNNQPEQLFGEVLDYSEQGVGIKVNSAGNLPKKGDRLFCLSFKGLQSKEMKEEVAVIRNLDSVTNGPDLRKPYFRIGLEFVAVSKEDKSTVSITEFPTRPTRYTIEESFIEKTKITFYLDEDKLTGYLLNFSKYGFAVKLQRETPLKLSNGKLQNVVIKIKGKEVYTGAATIQNVRESKHHIILGCQVERNLIDINLIRENIKTVLAAGSIYRELEFFNETVKITSEFKAVVSDFRSYLEKVQDLFLKVPAAPDEIIQQIYPLFKAQMDEIYSRFALCLQDLSPADYEKYKSYFQAQTHPLFMNSPFLKHIYQKPYGYAGDFELVLKILDKEIEETSPLGKLINVYGWNFDASKAHRYRVEFLAKKITEVVKSREEPVKIMSIGCGPAREIKLFLEGNIQKRCEITLIDFDPRTLTYCQDELLSYSILSQSKVKLNFLNKSIRQIIKSKSCDVPFDKYDFIYCAGLFDYLSDPFCKRLLEIMHSQLKPEGYLLATNVTSANYYHFYMEFIGEWYLTYRSSNAMLNLAHELGMDLAVDTDPTGVNVFLHGKKVEESLSCIEGKRA